MKKILILFMLFIISYSQQINYVNKSNLNEYIEYIQQYSTNTYMSLNGSWKYKIFDTDQWEDIKIPSTITNSNHLILRRNFVIPDSLKNFDFKLNLEGINNEAYIKIDGELIGSYYFNGAPIVLNLDKNKLAFNKKLSLEIEFYKNLNYKSSYPRYPIHNEPIKPSGIIRDIYLEIVKYNIVKNVTLDNANAELLLTLNTNDSSISFPIEHHVTIMDFNSNITKEIIYKQNQIIDAQKIRIFNPQIKKEFIDLNKNLLIKIESVSLKQNTIVSSSIFKLVNNKLPKYLKIISKIDILEQYQNQLSLKEMESDVQNIFELGFNAIYFEFEYPHPYYFYLAEKYNLRILYNLALYSHNEKQLNNEKNSPYLNNYFANVANQFIPIIQTLSNNSTILSQLADHYQIAYVSSNVLNLGNLEIPLIKPLQATYGSQAGYLINQSEEAQAKYFKNELEKILSANDSSFLISTYTDYPTFLPSMANLNAGNIYLNQTGLLNINKEFKKSAYVVKDILKGEKNITFIPGETKPNDVYFFTILGIIILAIFVISFKQSPRLSENLKRSFFHSHGFFSDTRDRRILYMGQTLFIYIIISIILGNILATYLYINRDSSLLNSCILYFFSIDNAALLMGTIFDPIKAQILSIIIIIVLILILILLVKLLALFSKKRSNLKQCATIVIWAFVPVLFLIPVSVFLYNAMISESFLVIFAYLLIFMAFWILLRFINASRVLYEISHLKIYFILIIIVGIFTSALWYFLENSIELNNYLSFFNKMVN